MLILRCMKNLAHEVNMKDIGGWQVVDEDIFEQGNTLEDFEEVLEYRREQWPRGMFIFTSSQLYIEAPKRGEVQDEEE